MGKEPGKSFPHTYLPPLSQYTHIFWIKFAIANILRYIQEKLNGIVPRDFDTWVNFYEIGPKSASLILFAAFGLKVAVPVDVHVFVGFKRWGWMNGISCEQCSWQARKWVPEKDYIRINDVIGSIRQCKATGRGVWIVNTKAKEKRWGSVRVMIEKL